MSIHVKVLCMMLLYSDGGGCVVKGPARATELQYDLLSHWTTDSQPSARRSYGWVGQYSQYSFRL